MCQPQADGGLQGTGLSAFVSLILLTLAAAQVVFGVEFRVEVEFLGPN